MAPLCLVTNVTAGWSENCACVVQIHEIPEVCIGRREFNVDLSVLVLCFQ